MDDKERILMAIITRVIPKLAYTCHSIQDREKVIQSSFLSRNYQKGDLVIASTAFTMNDFVVGFVEEQKNDCVVIREIGSKRLCNYYNESFYAINKDTLGYEILEGVEYKTYNKVHKAFDKFTGYNTRFKSVSFENKKCLVEAREVFSEELKFQILFEYNSKTSIKSIGEILKQAESEVK